MKAVILARVSTEMQQDGFSLDAQLDRLRKALFTAREPSFMKQLITSNGKAN